MISRAAVNYGLARTRKCCGDGQINGVTLRATFDMFKDMQSVANESGLFSVQLMLSWVWFYIYSTHNSTPSYSLFGFIITRS
jgi:hypothetical protein